LAATIITSQNGFRFLFISQTAKAVVNEPLRFSDANFPLGGQIYWFDFIHFFSVWAGATFVLSFIGKAI
jgi:hypothetical protein